jgi:predicted MPP superfamily phosphohydrolase
MLLDHFSGKTLSTRKIYEEHNVDKLASQADIILLCGDLTDYGKPEEAQALALSLSGVGRIPVLAVLGNHDYECGQAEEVERILCASGVTMLDGTSGLMC